MALDRHIILAEDLLLLEVQQQRDPDPVELSH